jgi:serine/threonine protein kinase
VDLWDMWKPTAVPKDWQSRQFQGLISALASVHLETFGGEMLWHGALRPEAIHWVSPSFPDISSLGTLKIGDWEVTTLEYTERESSGAVPFKYAPPETRQHRDHSRDQYRLHQLDDVWSLGCVFFEMLLYHLEDTTEAVEGHTFKAWRRDPRFSDGEGLHSSTSELMERMALEFSKSSSFPESFSIYLDLIRNNMLVAELDDFAGADVATIIVTNEKHESVPVSFAREPKTSESTRLTSNELVHECLDSRMANLWYIEPARSGPGREFKITPSSLFPRSTRLDGWL